MKSDSQYRKLTIVVKPFKAEAIVDFLYETNLSPEAVLIREVRGFGRQKGYLDQYVEDDADMTFVPKVLIEVWVEAESAREIEEKIYEIACTGRIGDGKIFSTAVEQMHSF